MLTSSSENKGIDDLWTKLTEFKETMLEHNEFYSKRQSQLKLWFWTHLKENLLESLLAMPQMKRKLDILENEVINGINIKII